MEPPPQLHRHLPLVPHCTAAPSSSPTTTWWSRRWSSACHDAERSRVTSMVRTDFL